MRDLAKGLLGTSSYQVNEELMMEGDGRKGEGCEYCEWFLLCFWVCMYLICRIVACLHACKTPVLGRMPRSACPAMPEKMPKSAGV